MISNITQERLIFNRCNDLTRDVDENEANQALIISMNHRNNCYFYLYERMRWLEGKCSRPHSRLWIFSTLYVYEKYCTRYTSL